MSPAIARSQPAPTRPRASRRAVWLVAAAAAIAGVIVASLLANLDGAGSGTDDPRQSPDAVRLLVWQEEIARVREERAQRLLDRLYPGQALVEVTVELESTVWREQARIPAEWPAVRSRTRVAERGGDDGGRRHDTRTDELEPFVGTRETTSLAPAVRSVHAVLVLDPAIGTDLRRKREIAEAVRGAIGTADGGRAQVEVLVEPLDVALAGQADSVPAGASVWPWALGVALAGVAFWLGRRRPGTVQSSGEVSSPSQPEASPLPSDVAEPLAAVPQSAVAEEVQRSEPAPSQPEADIDDPFAQFASYDPRDLASIFGESHPQLAAIVLVRLPTERAADVLAALPRDLRADVLGRVASLEHVAPDAASRAIGVLEDEIARRGLRPGLAVPASGTEAAAAMLNLMGEHDLLSDLEESDPDVAARVRERMFTFDDLERLDGRSLQRVLSRVDARLLALALKAASPAVEQRVFDNLSRRAGALVREEREVLGPTPRREVEEAQGEVTTVVRDLLEREEILLDDRGAELL